MITDPKTKVGLNEEIANRMLQKDRKVSLDAMLVNSTQGLKDVTFNFSLHKYLRSLISPQLWYNPNYLNVTVTICCVEEKLKNFWKTIPEVKHKSFVSDSDTGLLFVFPRSNDLAYVTTIIKLTEVHKLLPDFESCSPEKISAFSDEKFS